MRKFLFSLAIAVLLAAVASFAVEGVSKGARAAVEALGGTVTLPEAVPSEHEKKTARREVNKADMALKTGKAGK